MSQATAIACLVLTTDADVRELSAYAQRIPGVDADAVRAAVAELLQGYERPRLDARACELALAGDD
jgi:hypothetical protein